jgi:cytochrome b involved in lipid metabolism
MSIKKVTSALAVGFFVLALSACGGEKIENVEGSETTTSVPADKAPVTDIKLTVEEVAKHNTEADCYTIVQGEVYDLTEWIYMHPGGAENIMSVCGADGSNAFMGQHGGMSRPQEMLANYKLGALES